MTQAVEWGKADDEDVPISGKRTLSLDIAPSRLETCVRASDEPTADHASTREISRASTLAQAAKQL